MWCDWGIEVQMIKGWKFIQWLLIFPGKVAKSSSNWRLPQISYSRQFWPKTLFQIHSDFLAHELSDQWSQTDKTNRWHTWRAWYQTCCCRSIRDRKQKLGAGCLLCVCSSRSGWRIFLFLLRLCPENRSTICRPCGRTLTLGPVFQLFSTFRTGTTTHMWDPYLPRRFVWFIPPSEVSARQLGWHWWPLSKLEIHRLCKNIRRSTEVWILRKSQWGWHRMNCCRIWCSIHWGTSPNWRNLGPAKTLQGFFSRVRGLPGNNWAPFWTWPGYFVVRYLFFNYLHLWCTWGRLHNFWLRCSSSTGRSRPN